MKVVPCPTCHIPEGPPTGPTPSTRPPLATVVLPPKFTQAELPKTRTRPPEATVVAPRMSIPVYWLEATTSARPRSRIVRPPLRTMVAPSTGRSVAVAAPVAPSVRLVTTLPVGVSVVTVMLPVVLMRSAAHRPVPRELSANGLRRSVFVPAGRLILIIESRPGG